MPHNNHPSFPGAFIISLDFELHWGVRDVKSVDQYRRNLLGVRQVVPALLKIFAEYDIHATWATVGFLFFKTRADLLASRPDQQPNYEVARLSPYLEMQKVGCNEEDDPFHFGRSLIEQIMACPTQEIATHTFSHYYCLEPRQNLDAFRSDLRAALRASANLGVTLKSIVFPRNQYDRRHLEVCRRMGLKAFRGNPDSWLYRPRSAAQETPWRRSARLLDAHWDISGHHSYSINDAEREPLLNLSASRFLRPYLPSMKPLSALHQRRILTELTYAAEHGLVYHLWWHPHNFGAHLEPNMALLRTILNHFRVLRERYAMQSTSMAELTSQVSTLTELQDHAHTEEYSAVRQAE